MPGLRNIGEENMADPWNIGEDSVTDDDDDRSQTNDDDDDRSQTESDASRQERMQHFVNKLFDGLNARFEDLIARQERIEAMLETIMTHMNLPLPPETPTVQKASTD